MTPNCANGWTTRWCCADLRMRTRETYLACVAALAKHYRLFAGRLDAAQLQAYLLHLITRRKLAYASVNQAACAFRFLFERGAQAAECAPRHPMAKVPKRLPVSIGAGRHRLACSMLVATCAAAPCS